jgi:hypothetical protein
MNRLVFFDLAGNFSFFDIESELFVHRFVKLIEESVSCDPDADPNGPAGTCTISARFRNNTDETSNITIFTPFFQVVRLEDNKLLTLPGEVVAPSPGGVGATMTPAPSGREPPPFMPGATGNFQFKIGLQSRQPFSFFVNMLGQATR